MDDIYCFGGNSLDRASERRDDGEWIAKLLGDAETRILALRDLKPFIRGTTVPALDWQPVAPWLGHIDAGAPLIFLGLGDGRAHFAIDAAGADVAPDVDTASIDVRALAPTIALGEAAILAEARSLLDWHSRHRFCAQCGSPTRVASAGWKRCCPECRASHFPRTDPVVIMLATRGDRALLGRNRRRPGARFSCLAGFVEPGETPEEAVRREVREEAGVRCGRVRYLAAQPWPFPSSLMMGVSRRGSDRGDHRRRRGNRRGALVLARRSPSHGRACRRRPRRSGAGVAAVAHRDRPSHLPALVERPRQRVIRSPMPKG
jgi:NAD+ diphosphatase